MPASNLIFRFIGVDEGASAQFDRMAAKSSATAASLKAFGVGAAVAFGVVAVESIKAASKFQASTELIHTQAGVSQAAVDQMRKSILGLAGGVATAPEALSEAMFHIASTGARGATAINELRTAAEGAKVGQADLTDVTNALNATIVSGIKGAGNFGHAMGALNAIVGAGDMHMQDLSDALGTGVLITMRTFGVSLNQAGAALAVFGDNNIRGSQAATYLRQAVQSISMASPNADKALAQIGLTAADLQDKLASGGLTGALRDLHSHFVSSGVDANKWGDIMEQAFTKKAGTGISILIEEWGRYQLKQAEVRQGAQNFAGDWSATTKTLSFQFQRLQADVQVLAVKFGTALIPVALDVIHAFLDVGNAIKATVGFFTAHKTATLAVAGALTGALIPALVRTAASMGVVAWESLAGAFMYARDAVISFAAGEDVVAGSSRSMMGALGPIGVALAVVGAVGAITWERNRAASQAAKSSVDDYVNSLHASTTSLASLNSAIAQMKSHATSTFTNLIDTKGPSAAIAGVKEYETRLQSLQGQQKTVAFNEQKLAGYYGISTAKVESLAQANGIDLTGSLLSTQQAMDKVITAATLTHHPVQAASAAFQDLGSNVNTVTADVNDLDTAWNNLVGNFVGMKQAQLSAKQALDSLDAALKKSNNSLSLNTKAGQAARGALLAMPDAIKAVIDATYTQTGSYAKAAKAAQHWLDGIKASGAAGPIVKHLSASIQADLAGVASKAPGYGQQTGTGYAQGLGTSQGAVAATARKVAAAGVAALRRGDAHGAGVNFGQSYAAGIAQTAAAAGVSAASIVTSAINAVNHAQQSHSPSRVAWGLGGWFGQGYVDGVKAKTPAARSVGQYLAEGLKVGVEDRAKILATAINGTMSQALSALKSGADKMLTQMKSDLSKAQSQVQATVSAMKQLRQSDISSLTGDSALSNITGGDPTSGSSPLGTQISALQAQDAVRQAIAAYIADPTQLNALLVTQAQQSAVTASQVVPTPGTSGGLTGKGIVAGLRSDSRNLHEFIDDYHKLQRKGLDGPLLKQILAMGPDQGLAYEKALLADPAAIRQADRYEKSILASSKAFGTRDANDKYSAQLAEQTKAVKEQTKAIQEQNRLLKELAADVGSEVGKSLNNTSKNAQKKGKARAAK